MDLDFQKHLPPDFDGYSRVWIYQSSRQFMISEALELEEMLEIFCSSWESHGAKVKGFANLFFGRFIVIMADEKATGVSGCSTDSSVRMVKEIEKRFNVELFNRLLLAFVVKDRIEIIPMAQLKPALENGFIGPDTLYFNNMVLNKKELEENWIIPLRFSWLAKQLQLPV